MYARLQMIGFLHRMYSVTRIEMYVFMVRRNLFPFRVLVQKFLNMLLWIQPRNALMKGGS